MAARRLGWLIWPWMGTPPKPRLRSISAMRRVVSQVRVKMMVLAPASSVLGCRLAGVGGTGGAGVRQATLGGRGSLGGAMGTA